jgi:hypothetical protein
MRSATVHHSFWLLALGAAFLGGCRAAPEPAAEVEEVRIEEAGADTLRLPRAELERARQTANSLGQELAGLVFSTLEQKGAAAAVSVCSEIAQERTAAHGADGVYVRRVSDRVRNPRNEPDEPERRELERMHEMAAEGRLPSEIVRLVRAGDERWLHLLRPIRIQPPCLTCHGESAALPPEVREILAERYPEDRAVGYAAGQLRGAISVRVPLGAVD